MPYYPSGATSDQIDSNLAGYLNNERTRLAQGNKFGVDLRGLGQSGAILQGTFGLPAERMGLSNLYRMLATQGRVDPRLLARAQARNSISTQQQMDAARAQAARTGLGGGGLNQAIQASIGAAGADRAANLNYQDIADSYARNQQNLGLLDQLVLQPQLAYANLGVQDMQDSTRLKAAKLGAFASLLGGASKALTGGFGG